MIPVYLATVLAASLWLAVARATWLYLVGTLPDQYHLLGVLWNAGVALALGVLVLPGALLLYGSMRRWRWVTPGRFGSLLGILAVCLPFWILSTTLEYRDSSTWAGSLQEEAVLWLPAIGLAMALWWTLLTKRPRQKVVQRCLAYGGIAVIVAGAFHAYALSNDPSESLPLEFDASARRRPPVFLVLVDTLRADHLPLYGYSKPTSPNLDAFAEDATVYERTFAHAPWTRPSCGALLSSRFPPEIGLRGMWDPLPADVPILPEFMAIEGYRTAGIVSSVHLSAQYGFDKGWDLLDLGTTYLRWTGVQRMLTRLRLIRRAEMYPRYNARELTDRSIAWLEANRESAEPPFMYLHYSDPHAPYLPPAGEDRWHEFASEEGRKVAKPPKMPPMDGPTYSSAQFDAMLARYDAEVAYFDDHFGRFLDYLRERDTYDSALIIVTADHGEEFGEHGGWAHGHTLYNELLNVPLIIKYPRDLAPAGVRDDRLAGLIDVVPTVQAVLGAAWPGANFRGRSLLSSPVPDEGRFVYADNEEPSLRAAYHGNDKLIQALNLEGRIVRELYFAMDADYDELGDGNVTLDSSTLNHLRGLIEATYDRQISAGSIDVDEDTLEELRALGYVE